MNKRHIYSLNLSDFTQSYPCTNGACLQFRTAQFTDISVLAELMIDAYRGTIDYDDETLDDAVGEIRAYLAGERGGQPLLAASHLVFAGPLVVGACLVAAQQSRQDPLIAYIMIRGEWKQRGVGKQVLWTVLQALRTQGYQGVEAVITAGNRPSEALFRHLGFQQIR